MSSLAGFVILFKSKIPGVENVIHDVTLQSELFRFSSWNLVDLRSVADILFCSCRRDLTLFSPENCQPPPTLSSVCQHVWLIWNDISGHKATLSKLSEFFPPALDCEEGIFNHMPQTSWARHTHF